MGGQGYLLSKLERKYNLNKPKLKRNDETTKMVKLIQKQTLQITLTLRKSDIANVNLIIPCKDLLQMIKLNKIDEDTDIFSFL